MSEVGPATRWLFERQRFGVTPSLDGVRALLERLGRPQARYACVLVAGTNGKGATTSALAEMLRQAGVRSGRFVSPHLSQPGERIVVDGSEMAADAFEAAAAEIRPHVEAVGATFFEAVTALGCRAFARAGCDTVVFEVGMGGRWDATNALDPVLSLITSVGLDHTDRLGGTIAEIAAEKAGVLRRGRPAWTSARGEALEELRRRAWATGAPLGVLGEDARVEVRSRGWDGLDVRVGVEGRQVSLRTPWLGRHQGENLALAALGAREMGVPWDAIRAGAASAGWPGRLEAVASRRPELTGVRVLLDGAHNPDAARALASALDDLAYRPYLVFGASREKDLAGVLAALAPSVSAVFATRARLSPRARDPAEIAEAATAAGIPAAGRDPDPRTAVALAAAAARNAGDDSAGVLVAGSLYLGGEVRAWLLGEEPTGVERWQ